MDNQNTDIYTRINVLLRQQGKTKVGMAEATKIPLSTITSLFQRKSKNMKLQSVRLIAEYLGVSVDYLIMGYEPEKGSDAQEVNSNINFSKMDYEINENISRIVLPRQKLCYLHLRLNLKKNSKSRRINERKSRKKKVNNYE